MGKFFFTVQTLEHRLDPTLVRQVILQVFYMLVAAAAQVRALNPRVVNRVLDITMSIRWSPCHEHYIYTRTENENIFNIKFDNELSANQHHSLVKWYDRQRVAWQQCVRLSV